MNSFVSLTRSVIFLNIFPYRFVRPQIARFMGPTWGPPGSCRPQLGPMLAPWTLLSGTVCMRTWLLSVVIKKQFTLPVTQAPSGQPRRPWGGHLLSYFSADQVVRGSHFHIFKSPRVPRGIYVFVSVLTPQRAPPPPLVGHRVLFMRICFIVVRIYGPDLLIIWFPSWLWPWISKVKYGICYISGKLVRLYVSWPGDLRPFFATCIKIHFSTKRIISDVYADMNIICFYLYWEVGRIPPLFAISKNSDCFKNSSSEVHNRSCCSCMVGISCVDLYKYVLTISYMKYRFLSYHLRSHENNRSQWQETLFTRCRLSLPENIFTSPEMADGKPALDSISKGLWDHYISVRKRCVPFMEIRFIIVLLWLV